MLVVLSHIFAIVCHLENKKFRSRGFIINQINKLTIKFFSKLSNINIRCYLKFRISIMHREFFKMISQNPEYVKTHCLDLYNPFQFGCRKWYSDSQWSYSGFEIIENGSCFWCRCYVCVMWTYMLLYLRENKLLNLSMVMCALLNNPPLIRLFKNIFTKLNFCPVHPHSYINERIFLYK